jgi:Viral BACON domain
MKKAKKRYVATLLSLAIPLLVFHLLTMFFASPARAEGSEDFKSALVVNPTSLAFSYQQGGTLPPRQSLSVTSRRTTSFSASTSGAAWLSVSPTSGSTPGSVAVSVSPGSLAAGTYTASVLLASRAGSLTVPVSLTVTSPPRVVVSPTSLTFSYQQGGSVPSAKTLSVTSTSGAINFTDSVASGGSWLSVSRTSGSTASSIGVSVNPGSLAVGTYTGSVRVSSSANSVTVPVTLTVTSTSATSLVVSPTSLTFSYQQGGTVPSAKTLAVTSSNSTTTISFTDSASGGSWLSVNRTSGSTPSSIGVSVNPGSLSAGTYSASVPVTSSAGSITVPVTLTVTSSSGGGGTAGYALLAWSELGMHCMDGKDYSVFSVLPPYNTIYAKLLTTGGQPLPVTSGVTITYQALKDASGSINTTSAGTSTVAQKTNFWTWVYTLFGLQEQNDVGLHGYPVQSLTPQPMTYDSTKGLWKAEGVPTAPYDDTGASKSYPMAQIIARNSSGQQIATATVVLAVSDELSCNNCHAANTNNNAMPSGGWITVSGYTDAQNVKLNILKKHDDTHPISSAVLTALQAKGANYKRYQASLYQTALAANNPVLCADCHASNALNAAGLSTGVKDSSGNLLVPPLTTSMHTLHSGVSLPGSATTLDNATDPANSCYQCHPGVNTKCQRGTMSGVACFNCHGNLSRVGTATRSGWLDEPNCQMCHQSGTTYTTAFTSANIGPSGTQRTSTDTTFATNPNVPSTGFSLYRFSQGHGSTECSACHGSQHAEYPTNQPNDQVYSTNLQGYAGRITECSVCHGSSFATTNNGGPHGMHTVGSAWVSAHPNYAEGGASACAYCHGADYRGTTLSQILTTKTLAGHTFPAGHQISCYDCHNGPSGD